MGGISQANTISRVGRALLNTPPQYLALASHSVVFQEVYKHYGLKSAT
jgi:hypothetical protein